MSNPGGRTSGNTVPASLFRPAGPAKPYLALADRLRDAILNGQIAEGDRLPAERELVELSGLSRAAVREALRVLAVEGLLVTRQGRSGGNIVTLPGPERIDRSVDQFVRGNSVPLGQLREARASLEPALARLAALNRDTDDLAALWQCHREIQAASDFRRFSRSNMEWHLAVARASGNRILTAMFRAIANTVEMADLVEEFDTAEIRAQVIKVHRRITKAIEQRNPELAHALMEHHISATEAQSRTPGSAPARWL